MQHGTKAILNVGEHAKAGGLDPGRMAEKNGICSTILKQTNKHWNLLTQVAEKQTEVILSSQSN